MFDEHVGCHLCVFIIAIRHWKLFDPSDQRQRDHWGNELGLKGVEFQQRRGNDSLAPNQCDHQEFCMKDLPGC